MKGQRSLLLKGAAWVSAGGLVVNALGFVSLIVLTRILLPEDFGLVAIAASFAEILGMIARLSLGQALIQRQEVQPAHYHTAWTMNVIRGVIIAAILFTVAPHIAQLYGDPRLTDLLQFLALTPLITGFINPKLVMFQRELDFSQNILMSIISKATVFIFSISVAVIYQSYWALVVGTIAAAIVSLFFSYIFIPYRPSVTLEKWRDLLSFSIWLTLSTWIQAVNGRATPLILGFFLPTPLLGQHRIGNQVLSKTADEAVRPIKALLFPAFSRVQDQAQRMRNGYIRSQTTICLITFPIMAGVAVLAEDLVVLMIGAKWLPAVPIIQIMAISRCLNTVHNVRAVAMATASTKQLFYRNLVVFCTRWPLTLLGMYLFRGDPYAMLIGAMLGQAASNVFSLALNVQLVSYISAISARDHLALMWRPFVSVATMSAIVLLADSAIAPATEPLFLGLRALALAILGALIYFGVLYAIWVIRGRGDTTEKELVTIVRGLADKALLKIRPS